jgi:tetratricopeptide (TPR) repeat protein
MAPVSRIVHGLSVSLLPLLVLSFHGCGSREEPASGGGVSRSAPPARAPLRDGMGEVEFRITTDSAEAQAFFNQGVAQLYAFWHSEAERSFREAARLDPDAAMPNWGIAMAAPGDFVPMYQLAATPDRRPPVVVPPNSSEGRARDAIVRAHALSDSLTQREQMYINAVAARRNPFLSDPDAAYIEAMRELVEAFPEDLEAKVLLALVLENGYEGSTKSPEDGTPESLALLRQVLATDSDHVGAMHFFIHALEGGRDIGDALPLADRYAARVPNIPHALHMPGHVYGLTGRFDQAVESFLTAAAKEREYMAADEAYSKQPYLHNEILFIHVLGLQGNYQEAMSRIGDLMSARDSSMEGNLATLYYRNGWFASMRTLVRFEKWEEILDGQTLASLDQPFETIWYHWARGLAYSSTSNLTGAQDSLRQMEQAIESFGRIVTPAPRQFVIAYSELQAYIDATTENLERGLDGLNRAATLESELPYTEPKAYPRPVLELLGRTALDARNFQTAESAYRRALENEPGSGRALWGLARALEGLGESDGAEEMLNEFRRVWRGEDPRQSLNAPVPPTDFD